MAKRIIVFIGAILFLITPHLVLADEDALLSVIKRIIQREVVPLSKQDIIVTAVKEANQEAVRSLDEIKRLDKKWMEAKAADEWVSGFLNNPCAHYLKKFQKDTARRGNNFYCEIFVMDKQGNIVAETNMTSDYRQGDEDKFVKSFAGGKGAVFIDSASYDNSSKKYSIQVSVPVRDPGTKEAIGALTAGIDLDVLAEQFMY